MKSVVQQHWNYFLLLEKDLIAISETLELSEKNFDAYGPRIAKLILSLGSELDVALKSLAKILCPEHAAATKARTNMGDYKDFIAGCVKAHFSSARVKFLRSELVLNPWAQIKNTSQQSIEWWDTYNAIKHDRTNQYENANLKTALYLISALFVVDVYISEARQESGHLTHMISWHGPRTSLFPRIMDPFTLLMDENDFPG